MKALLTQALTFSALFSGAMVLSPLSQAQLPDELPHVNCSVLIAQSLESGLRPKVTVDPAWGIVRITAEKNYCREPQEVWYGRALDWSVVITPDAEAPKRLLKQKEALTSQTEPEKPQPVAPTPSITSTPLPLPEPIPVETTPPPRAPEATPYLSGDRLPSIISGDEEIPETVTIHDGQSSIPKLADLVQTKMAPKQQQPDVPVEPSAQETGIDYLYLALWGAIGSLSLGFIVVLYFTLHKPKTRLVEDDADEEDA